MKALISAILVSSMLTGLAACGSGQSQASASEDAPPPVSHTVFAPYVNEVNKAKHVQSVVNAQKQALDKEINTQTGGGTSTRAPAAQTP